MERALAPIAFAALSAIACCTPAAHAVDAAYPNWPIRIVAPYATAWPSDVLVRIVEPRLSENIGRPVIVDVEQLAKMIRTSGATID